MSEKKGSKKIYLVLAVTCAAGLLACVIWLVKYGLDISSTQKQLDDIKDNYVQEEPSSQEPSVEEPSTEDEISEEEAALLAAKEAEEQRLALMEQYCVPEKEIDFDALHAEQNEDIYAWITIPDTKIDYPILQHPDELDYYLDHNINGSKGYPGCIYSQLMNSKDFSDRVTILYGHNMKNGTMFANLHYYEDPVFLEEHPYVYIYTEEEILVYQIFAAYEYHNGHILMYNDVVTDEGFLTYIDDIYARDGMRNQYDEAAKPQVEDRILDLSTCISNKATKRWLVSAVLRAEIPTKGNSDEAQQG